MRIELGFIMNAVSVRPVFADIDGKDYLFVYDFDERFVVSLLLKKVSITTSTMTFKCALLVRLCR